ncbi:MAG: FtsW/RodA/SpoVE family cell cycle protein [Longimicrobiales bacterium]
MKRRVRRARDLASNARSFPDTGLGRGWESPAILGVCGFLLLAGLLTLHSGSSVMAERRDFPHYYYVLRQGTGIAAGLVAMAVCARLPTAWWKRLAWPVAIVTWVLLVVVILPWTEAIAPEVNGARRWLRVGFSIQPSDLAKIAVIVLTASLAVRKQGAFKSLRKGMGPFLAVWALLLIPIAMEPDFSTTALIGMLGCLILFVAGARVGHFVLLGLCLSPLLAWKLGGGYRAERWSSLFLDPGSAPTGSAFQSYQSLIALGSGGVTGLGFGEGQQKFGFLPEAHNDFIFAMIGEEWGLVGVLLVVAAYVSLILVGFRVARRAKDLFGEFLAVGVTSLIGLQAFLHIGVGVGVLPPTGLALPLVSYGRSNMLVMLVAVGILLAVAREAPEGRSGRGSFRRAT